MLLNKIDLLPYVPFNVDMARRNAETVHPGIQILEISCTTGQGVDAWLQWIEARSVSSRAASS
jgi:hydrogenase nickel incorporation protein HypB